MWMRTHVSEEEQGIKIPDLGLMQSPHLLIRELDVLGVALRFVLVLHPGECKPCRR
jgi:hypothetical protein